MLVIVFIFKTLTPLCCGVNHSYNELIPKILNENKIITLLMDNVIVKKDKLIMTKVSIYNLGNIIYNLAKPEIECDSLTSPLKISLNEKDINPKDHTFDVILD